MKAISAVILSTALLSGAHAVGLGKIHVLSALGQPLNAEIELHSTSKDEADNLKIRLAPLETFRVANIEYNPVLSALRFDVEQRNGQPVIRVSSSRPINEPFVDLLLEVEGQGSRLIREYTFMLDPLDLRRPQPVQMAAAPAPVAAASAASPQVAAPSVPQTEFTPSSPAALTQPEITQPEPARGSIRETVLPATRATPALPTPTLSAASEQPAVNAYTVSSGDTLGRIARQVAPEGVSLDQMLVALHRANPQAFSGNNMNRLRSGRILNVPDADALRAVTDVEARRIVVAQARDFNQYKERLASQVAMSSAVAGDEAGQSASGTISTQVEESGSTTTARDRLQLSNAGLTGAGSDRAGANAYAEEELIAKEKALAEANTRIAELEKNLGAMQRLLQLQNTDMAERQTQASASAQNDAVAISVAPVIATATELEANASAPFSDTAAPGEAVVAAGTEAAVSETTEAQPPVQAEAPAPVAAAPEAKPKPVVAPPPVEEPSFVDDLLAHPLLLPLTGILAALGLVGVMMRRRRQQQEALARDSFVQGNSLFGSTGGQSVDTNNSVFSTNFSPSASQLDANEVDPIAEADVYIAYQKDDQAEEILKDALRSQPTRHNVRVKLLEIYHRRKDLIAFAAGARELQVMTGGMGDEWLQAAEMGRELDPNNLLYAAAAAGKGDSHNPSAEELDLGALLNSTRLPEGEQEAAQASLSMVSGGMAFDSDKSRNTANESAAVQAYESPSLDFHLDTDQGSGKSGSVADEANDTASLIEWDVEQDITEMKAAASKDASEEITFAAPEADADDLDILSILGSEDMAEDKPLDFDLSDIDLGLSNGKEGKDADIHDPLAQLISSPADSAAAMQEKKEEKEAASEDAMPELKLDMSFDAFQEPKLDLEIPEVPKASEQADALSFAPASGAADISDGSMWEESQDEVALAQPSIPLPSLGPISTETELSTKLDLAVAYREIGDKEGARELLDEVVASGHAEFAKKAKDLLQKMA